MLRRRGEEEEEKQYTKLGDLRLKFLKFDVEGRCLGGGDWEYRLLWELDTANT